MPALEPNFMMMEIEQRIKTLSSLDDLEMKMVNIEWLLGRLQELVGLHEYFSKNQTVYGGSYPVQVNARELLVRPEIRERFGLK